MDEGLTTTFWVKLLVALAFSAFVGGGAVTSLLLRGLRETLRETFATKDELSATNKDLKEAKDTTAAVQSLALQARGSVDNLHDEVRGLQKDHTNQVQRFGEVVVEPLRQVVARLEDISARQAKQGEALAAHSEALKGFGRSMDTLRDEIHRLRPPPA